MLQDAMAGQRRSYEIHQQASPTFLLVKHVLCDVGCGAGANGTSSGYGVQGTR